MFRPSSRFQIVSNPNQATLSLKDRVRVLDAYKDTPCYSTLANQFNCSIVEIKAIHRRGKKKVLREYVKDKTKKCLGIKYIQSDKDSEVATLLEKILYEWFQRAQRHKETGSITNEMLIQRAEEAKLILPMKKFKIDLDWVLKFRQKYNITDLDMTMLMLGNGETPLDVDMYEIAVQVVDQSPLSAHNSSEERLSELYDTDIDSDNPNEQVQVIDLNSNSSSDGSRITDEADMKLEMPPITNDEQARRHLKPLEDYVLMKENYRAIGLITQLEEIFKTTTKD